MEQDGFKQVLQIPKGGSVNAEITVSAAAQVSAPSSCHQSGHEDEVKGVIDKV